MLTLFFTYRSIKSLFFQYTALQTDAETPPSFTIAKIGSAIIGLLSLQVLPFSFFLSDHHVIKLLMINTGFFMMMYVHLKSHIHQRKEEDQLLISLLAYEQEMKKKIYLIAII